MQVGLVFKINTHRELFINSMKFHVTAWNFMSKCVYPYLFIISHWRRGDLTINIYPQRHVIYTSYIYSTLKERRTVLRHGYLIKVHDVVFSNFRNIWTRRVLIKIITKKGWAVYEWALSREWALNRAFTVFFKWNIIFYYGKFLEVLHKRRT